MSNDELIDAIDAVLPQTQCTLCSYDGCRPYAEAIVLNGETISRCSPGGIGTLYALAELTNQEPTFYEDFVQLNYKSPSKAKIREAECIGCTKCIQACPVDAIIGSSKKMHTILADHCTGCDLCLPPCPVDCIEILPLDTILLTEEQLEKSSHWKKIYLKKQKRLAENTSTNTYSSSKIIKSLSAREKAVEDAVARHQVKKSNK